jgi:ABC-2 type transport system ATP-binding protein
VVVKKAVRELIQRRNREQGTTVFLTSHDPSDIEQLCRRAVVIDHGTVMLDLPVEQLKRDYINDKQKRVEDITVINPSMEDIIADIFRKR